MKPSDDVLQFLRTSYPDAIIEIHQHPSGAVTIDVRFRGLFVVVQYSPRHGFGASVLEANDSGFAEHDHAFETADEVKGYLSGVLRGESS